jgi:endonuclease YncB( thermonuclease family)
LRKVLFFGLVWLEQYRWGQQKDQDRYGRTVARCFLPNGQEINRLMIESGTAQEYVRFSRGFYSGDN